MQAADSRKRIFLSTFLFLFTRQTFLISLYSIFLRCWCVFAPPWQRAPVFRHQRQPCLRQSGSGAGRLSAVLRSGFSRRPCAAQLRWLAGLVYWWSDSQRRETERGGTWGRAIAKRNGNPSFYTWPVFLSLVVFVYLIVFFHYRRRDTDFVCVCVGFLFYF